VSSFNSHGTVVHYDVTGSGETILWIPGTGELGSVWNEYQVPRFRDGYECITVDLPGAGQSIETGEFTPMDLARALAELLDALGRRSVHVVGFSLGASVGQELAIARPDLVRSLTLIGSWSSTALETHIRRHTEARLYSLENATTDVYKLFAYWMIAPTLFDEEPGLRATIESLLLKHASSRSDGLARQYRANLAHDTRDRLGNVACATLLIYGEEDLIAFPRYGRPILDAIPDSRIVLIPRAGHLAILERPTEVNDAIASFLNEHGPTYSRP
jgi:pimeloyl-ACP methyl ester carboxylesterase